MVELEEAKRSAKKLSKHVNDKNKKDINELRIRTQLRIATAYHKLRQFRACKTAVAICQSMNPVNYDDIQTLKKYQADADAYLNSNFATYKDLLDKDMHDKLMSGEMLIDQYAVPHEDIGNTNLLQCCALSGDINTIERVIAYGASLDYELIPEEALAGHCCFSKPTTILPTNNTALVLLCANLVSTKLQINNSKCPLEPFARNLYHDILRQLEVCAVQFIMLGADVDRKLHLCRPSRREEGSNGIFVQRWRQLKLNGKTAREMIIRSKNQSVIDAMEAMKTDELKIANAHCRCGSRLRWKECHAGGLGEENYWTRSDKIGNKLLFRYSPMARCDCELTSKIHYDCCWKFGRIVYFLDDTSGDIMTITSGGRMPVDLIQHLNSMDRQEGLPSSRGTPLNAGLPEKSQRELKAGKCPPEMLEMIQSGWPLFCKIIPTEQHGKSGLDEYNPAVYAGCVSRIHNFFYWTNAHWRLEESELLVRVREWNEGLKLYCDDHNLTGEARSKLYERHKASEFAPCGSRPCNNREKKVKSFRMCSGCKKIAYCSKRCQKEDWKRHKQECGQHGDSSSHVSDLFRTVGLM